VGNTHLKYTWFEPSVALANIRSEVIALEQLPSLLSEKPEVFLCSVKSNVVTSSIITLLTNANVVHKLAVTKAVQFGIQNSYKHVNNMGCDRWMAILGADAVVDTDLVVIDAGTAITCDFIVNKQHLGGWIAPGFGLLRETVVNRTQRVFDFSDVVPKLTPGTDTANCVANGAFAQTIGIIAQAQQLMMRHSRRFSIVLTGGDRSIIERQLRQDSAKVLVHSNLVLAGLARLCLDS
jgi:type III pantothenate kinase